MESFPQAGRYHEAGILGLGTGQGQHGGRQLVVAGGRIKHRPVAWAGVLDGHLNGLSGGGHGLPVGLLQRGRVGGAPPGRAHLREQKEAVGGLGRELHQRLPRGAQGSEGRAEGDVVAGGFGADGARTLIDGVLRVGKGPVIGHPQLGQAVQRHSDGLALAGHVGVHQHHVVDSPEQRNLVAGRLVIVFEDGGNGLLTGDDGH